MRSFQGREKLLRGQPWYGQQISKPQVVSASISGAGVRDVALACGVSVEPSSLHCYKFAKQRKSKNEVRE